MSGNWVATTTKHAKMTRCGSRPFLGLDAEEIVLYTVVCQRVFKHIAIDINYKCPMSKQIALSCVSVMWGLLPLPE